MDGNDAALSEIASPRFSKIRSILLHTLHFRVTPPTVLPQLPANRARHFIESAQHGQDFEVTRERIRQIEAKALRKLRHPSRSKRLKSFMES